MELAGRNGREETGHPGGNMAEWNTSGPGDINPNLFPAKLWRLVNSPAVGSIGWDRGGRLVVIDQQLFEARILSPASRTASGADVFKTTHFSSFIRQLNLYGFRKVDPPAGRGEEADSSWYHHFYNPNFQRSQPELLKQLVRLTVDNKARLHAGRDISSRLPLTPGNQQELPKGGGSLLQQPSHRSAAHPYLPAKPLRPQSGTPIPPAYLHRVPDGAPFSASLNWMRAEPIPSSHLYSGAAAGSRTMQLPTYDGSPPWTSSSPPNQPGFHPPVCHCVPLNLVRQAVTGRLLPPSHYYQAAGPVALFHPHIPGSQEGKSPPPRVNLDLVFQIADEMMPISASDSLVKEQSREKPESVLQLSSDPSGAAALDNGSSAPVVDQVVAEGSIHEGSSFRPHSMNV